jgi:vacuolar-type H+-ATPase subunit F/Vma7
MIENDKRALVLGRQIFTDLWALEGFEKVLCEDPADLQVILKDVLNEDTGFILMEENWFEDLPEMLKKKLEGLHEPVIVIFPSITTRLI